MIHRDYLIVGAGVAAGAAVDALRAIDKKGSVAMIGAEPHPSYHRPQILPTFLGKKEPSPDDIAMHSAAWYAKNKVELRLDTFVVQLNTERRIAVVSGGQAIEFKKALLAMGSRPRRPQVAGANLGQVIYIRTLRDARALREIAEHETEIVIIGGGLIAMETAALLRSPKRRVTIMSRYQHLWQNRLDAETAKWLTDHFHAHGVHLLMGESLNGFEGKTVLRNVQTKSGHRFPAGVAIVAIGAEPNLDLIANTPLSSPNGIPVNDLLETDESGIFAAGDVALYPDRIFGGVRRVEHYACALAQGAVAGANITGRKRTRFDFVPHFSTTLFGARLDVVGDFGRPPSRCELVAGHRLDQKYVMKYYQGNYLTAMVLLNQDPKKVEAARAELRAHHAKR